MVIKKSKTFVAGSTGMVGSALMRLLSLNDNLELIEKTHSQLDLTNHDATEKFFKSQKFDQVYLAAAKVGGIHANNTFPAEFIYNNILIQTNVINSSFKSGVKKLLFLGSSCIYPKNAEQPIKESSLLSGKLESTNEPYAISKIAGIKLCESYNRQYGDTYDIDYRSVMPTNLYGPGDNYHPENSHVIPALIKRFHDAKLSNAKDIIIWGTGLPMREFLHVDDLAKACIHVMNIKKEVYQQKTKKMLSHINVGFGLDITIKELAYKIASVVNYKGNILFDHSKPSGTPRKLLDSSLINELGWQPSISLDKGLKITYEDYKNNIINK